MVILKSEEQIFDDNEYKDWNWLFFNNKEADCILYSEDGHEFRIHKEILCQTERHGFSDFFWNVQKRPILPKF